MLALRARRREEQWIARNGVEQPNLAQLLDLVALGTVADVVPLDHNIRILVSQGIARIRAGRCCAGIAALREIAGRNPRHLVAADLGFAVGPRLNAAGRLEDMSLGSAWLLADDTAQAREMAARLNALNHERRAIETQMQADALEGLGELQFSDAAAALPTGLCLYQSHWHQGVIGILASRIKDRQHRPVIAFAQGESGQLKGSARSVAGEHMRGVILSDGERAPQELNLELADLLRGAGPWGQAFPEPIFDGYFDIVQRRTVGERHLKMVVKTPGHDRVFDAIAFNTLDADWSEQTARVQLAYKLDVNEFRGQRSAQLLVEHMVL